MLREVDETVSLALNRSVRKPENAILSPSGRRRIAVGGAFFGRKRHTRPHSSKTFHNLNRGWSNENYEDSRENEEDQWEDEFNGRLGGLFLRDLAASSSHGIALDA